MLLEKNWFGEEILPGDDTLPINHENFFRENPQAERWKKRHAATINGWNDPLVLMCALFIIGFLFTAVYTTATDQPAAVASVQTEQK